VNKMNAAAPPPPKEPGEVRIKREDTTNTVERVIEGTTLRIPANYLTPFGLSAPAREAVTYVPLVMFFPSLEGYTPANWREVETSKDAVFVFIKRDSGARSVSTSVPCDANTASQGAGGRCEVVVVDPSSAVVPADVSGGKSRKRAIRLPIRVYTSHGFGAGDPSSHARRAATLHAVRANGVGLEGFGCTHSLLPSGKSMGGVLHPCRHAHRASASERRELRTIDHRRGFVRPEVAWHSHGEI